MSSLKFVMKGKPVPKGLGSTQSSVEKASKLSALMMEETKLPIAPPTTRTGTEISEIFSTAVPIPRTLALKPALLPCVGNVKSLPLAEKKKKLPKYKVSLKKSKTKLEPIIAEKKIDSIETEIETHEERRQSSDMEEAQCAVRMLVQEAEVLTQDETRPSSMKTKVKQKSSSLEIKGEIQSDTVTRSVDQIIESLWEQVHSEILSESDRRIQEIMNRVMSRGISQKTEMFQEISGEEDLSEKSEKSSQKQEIVEEKELKEEEEEEKETLVSLEYKDEKEEMTGTETEPTISEEDDVCITAVAGPWDIESFAEEDFNKLKAELNLPLHVSREDILSLKGHHVKTFSQIPQSIVKKFGKKKKIEMSFLSSWNDEDIITGGSKTQDSESKAIISKPNVKQHHFCTVTSEFEIEFPFTHVAWKYHTPNKFSKDFPIKDCRQSILIEAERFDKNTDIEENYHGNLEDWLHRTEKMFTDIELTVKGNHAPTIMTNDIHFWTLSPPKLHIQPAIIKQMMCPLYYGSFNPGRYISFENKKRTEKKTAAEKLLDNFIDKDEEEIEQLLKERLLEQKSESSRDLTAYAKEQCPNLDLTDTFCIKHMDQSPPLLLPSDYESLNKEMQEHKKSICEMNKKKQEQEELKKSLAYFDEEYDSFLETEGLKEERPSEDIPISKLRQHFKEQKSTLKRSQSVICLKKGKLLPSPKVQRQIQRARSKSLCFSLDLQQLTSRPRSVSGIFTPKKVKYKTELLEEKIPSRPKSEEFSESISEESSALMEDELSIYSSKRKICIQPEAISSVLPSDVSKIDLITDDPQKLELNKKIWAEIELLTKNIEESPGNWVFDTCRRGVLYRKVGELEKSFEDLNRVIESESVYFDAYWHRHFLYVLRGDYPSALDDLNFIQERKPTYKVFMALGVLYENMNNKNLALSNYTKATQIDSTNHLAYFYRAKLYEKIGNLNYAIGDYIKTSEKNPKHTEALKKQAEYFLKIKNWNVAISKISRLLELINDPEAFLIRAEAFIGLKIWKHALCDLSTAIHLGPSLWKAFYLRGCLLKNNP
ncbi:unnamed protein product [Acanthosepion pharaonis]|uniref:Uncharacterized protein n=1 Tax=Acanthosepion pharaonis TaxID=158019 RepID=A0A812BRR3_ACAPH|nr:unnamed protein product [Sepia pharaonis]